MKTSSTFFRIYLCHHFRNQIFYLYFCSKPSSCRNREVQGKSLITKECSVCSICSTIFRGCRDFLFFSRSSKKSRRCTQDSSKTAQKPPSPSKIMEHWNIPIYSIYYIIYNKYLYLKINHLQRVIPQNTTNFVDLRQLTKLEQMEQMEQKFPPKLHFRKQIFYLSRQPHEKKIHQSLWL